MVWVHCPVAPELLALVRPCRDAPGPLTLVLHILPPGATRRQTDPGSAGFAVPPEDGGFGAFAGVFHDRVRELATSINEAEVLGHVVAHELGHLLLGTGQHSAGGIMKGEWRYKQIILAAPRLVSDLIQATPPDAGKYATQDTGLELGRRKKPSPGYGGRRCLADIGGCRTSQLRCRSREPCDRTAVPAGARHSSGPHSGKTTAIPTR